MTARIQSCHPGRALLRDPGPGEEFHASHGKAFWVPDRGAVWSLVVEFEQCWPRRVRDDNTGSATCP